MSKVWGILLILALSIIPSTATAQVMTGFPVFGSFSGNSFDTVNNSNLNVHLAVPVVNKAGRGLPLAYALNYDSSIWYPVTSGSTKSWQPVPNWGWGDVTQSTLGYMTYTDEVFSCYSQALGKWYAYHEDLNWVYHDPQGTPHTALIEVSNASYVTPCQTGPTTATGTTTDGAYTIYAQATVTSPWGYSYSLSGATYVPPIQATTGSGSITDRNANEVTATQSGSTTTFTDTLGTTALTVSKPAPSPTNPTTLTYTAASGQQGTVTVKYHTYTVQTAFACSGITDFGPTQENLVSEIDLPDVGTNPDDKYTFTYETTPGHSPNITGRIASVVLPTGGTITYSYSGGSNGITCADGSTATLTRTTPDGQWTYAHSENGTAWTTTVSGPLSYSATYNFQTSYETERQIAGLETVYTCYNGAATPCNSTAVSTPITRRTITSSLGGKESETNILYNSNALPTEIDDYDFGTGAPGGLIRKTVTAYANLGNNIKDHPSSVTIYNGQGAQVAQTTYSYDQTGTTATSGTPQHGTPFGAQGNLTSVTSGGLTRTYTYFDTGNVHTSTDANGAQTTYNSGTGACGNAFPTTITLPLSLSVSENWNCAGAVMTSSTDANGKQTTFGYDIMNRLTSTSYPDTGSVTTSYTPTVITTTTTVASGVTRPDTTNLDSLGRISSQSIRGVTTSTTHDALGRVYQVSISGSGAQDTYLYDGLGRPTKDTHADNNYSQASYSGNCVTNTDEAGKTNQVCSDALGRVTSVVDGLGNTTSYTYNALDDLTGVTQGSQTRTFAYDSLGRLTSAATPESGTTSYYYTTSGGGLCSGDPSAVCRRTNPLATTTYTYDALHRLTSKSYNDTPQTPTVNFSYDQSSVTVGSWTSGTLANPKGRLTEATTTGNGSIQTAQVYSYDAMGRVANLWQCAPYNCGSASIWSMPYTYDLAGDVTSYWNPAGFTVTQGVDVNQRPTSLTYGANMAVSSITYTAWGAISTMCGGQGCAQSQETRQYNNRLQPVLMELGNSNNLSADYTLTYSYTGSASPPCTIPQGAGDNGSITGETYTDNVNAGYSHTFTYCYDAVDRLTHAVASGSPAYDLMYSYDQYGNGTCVPGSGGGLCPAMSYNSSTNRLTSIGSTAVSYDAAGNQLNDIWSTYEYDAEGRVKHSYSSGQWQYPTYNALGQRVQDYQGIDPMTLTYPIDIFGQRTGTFAQWPSQNWTGWNVYWSQIAGQRLNMGGASAYIDHSDAVGSTTMETDPAGAVQWDVTHYPLGGVFQEQGVRQSEVVMGLDWQVNDPVIPSATRELSSALGRWMTPDPAGRAAANPSNPQSWNRYAYVTNNPTTMTDPLGLLGSIMIGTDPAAAFNIPCFQGAICVTSSAFTGLDPMMELADYGLEVVPSVMLHPSLPPGKPAPLDHKGVFTCASEFAEKYSIAGGLHALGIGTSGVGGFITNALGGNMFSGVTDLVTSFTRGSAGGHSVFYNMGQSAIAGPSQGVPGVRGPWGASVSDLATGAIAGTYYNGVTGASETLTTLSGEVGLSLATKSAAEFATGVGLVKFGFDAATYIGGVAGCEAGVIY